MVGRGCGVSVNSSVAVAGMGVLVGVLVGVDVSVGSRVSPVASVGEGSGIAVGFSPGRRLERSCKTEHEVKSRVSVKSRIVFLIDKVSHRNRLFQTFEILCYILHIIPRKHIATCNRFPFNLKISQTRGNPNEV